MSRPFWAEMLRMRKRHIPGATYSRSLQCELLENRIAPVIGALADAAVVARGGSYDGVVGVNPPQSNFSSGALFRTGGGQGYGHHILTAAHVAGGAVQPVTVTFQMSRAGGSVDIPLQIETLAKLVQ